MAAPESLAVADRLLLAVTLNGVALLPMPDFPVRLTVGPVTCVLGPLTNAPPVSCSVTVPGAVTVPTFRLAPELVTDTSLPAPPATTDVAVPGINSVR